MPIGIIEWRAGIASKLKLRTTVSKRVTFVGFFLTGCIVCEYLCLFIHVSMLYYHLLLLFNLSLLFSALKFPHLRGFCNCTIVSFFKLMNQTFSYGFFFLQVLFTLFILNKRLLYGCPDYRKELLGITAFHSSSPPNASFLIY